jgi:hypothetical protein
MVLIGYWPLNETSGTTAYDRSGQNNHGTNNGANVGANGILGNNAYNFVSSESDYISHPTDIGGLSQVTVSAWVNPDSIPSNTPGHGGASTGDSTVMEWRLNGDDALAVILGNSDEVYFYVDNGSNNAVTTSTSPIATGSWQLITCTYGGGEGVIYVDGERISSFSASGPIITGSISATIASSAYNTPSDLYDGRIADVRVYNHALTASEVQYLYQVAQRGRLRTGKRS